MKKHQITLIILSHLVFTANAQVDSIVEMDFYKNHSKSITYAIESFQDTCEALYSCGRPSQLTTLGPWINDSIVEFKLIPIILVKPGLLNEYKENGDVILIIKDFHLIINKEILNSLSLNDSISYIGKRSFELKYSSFEDCLKKQNIYNAMTLKKLSSSPLEIASYYVGLPLKEECRKKKKRREKGKRKRKRS